MGNCCMRDQSSSMVWAGEDWGSVGPDGDKEGLLGGGGGSGRTVAAGAELRIKISKKQLEELLRRAEGGGAWGRSKKEAARGEKVLERLIERSVHVEVRRPAWRPKLQSIPEVD